MNLTPLPSVRLDVELSRPTAVEPSPRVLQVAAMFGLGIDEQRRLEIIPPTRIDLRGGQVVFVTGPSGSGKSSLLALIADALAERRDIRVVRFERLPTPPCLPLVDALGASAPDAPLEDVCRWLSLAGINDAFVMLRRPAELSDGQRYRLRLAQTFALVESGGGRPAVVLADEFGAALDRVTAGVIARNVRKWVRRHRSVCFVAATTHDDLLEALDPDLLVFKDLGQDMRVLTRPST